MRDASRPISSGRDVVPQVADDGQLAAVQGGVAEPGQAVVGRDLQGDEVAVRAGDDDVGGDDLHGRAPARVGEAGRRTASRSATCRAKTSLRARRGAIASRASTGAGGAALTRQACGQVGGAGVGGRDVAVEVVDPRGHDAGARRADRQPGGGSRLGDGEDADGELLRTRPGRSGRAGARCGRSRTARAARRSRRPRGSVRTSAASDHSCSSSARHAGSANASATVVSPRARPS